MFTDFSKSDSWAWGFTDVLFTCFAVILVFAVSLIKHYHPTLETKPDIVSDSIQNNCDSILSENHRLLDENKKLKLKNQISDPHTPSYFKSDLPLVVSFQWNKTPVGVALYIRNTSTGEYVYRGPFRSKSSWGVLESQGLDSVKDPDIAFIQPNKIVPGSYEIYLRITRPGEVTVKGFVFANLPNQNPKYIDLPTLKITSTAVPWGDNGNSSLVGTLIVTTNKIQWQSKS